MKKNNNFFFVLLFLLGCKKINLLPSQKVDFKKEPAQMKSLECQIRFNKEQSLLEIAQTAAAIKETCHLSEFEAIQLATSARIKL